jgi:hypothetical protein
MDPDDRSRPWPVKSYPAFLAVRQGRTNPPAFEALVQPIQNMPKSRRRESSNYAGTSRKATVRPNQMLASRSHHHAYPRLRRRWQARANWPFTLRPPLQGLRFTVNR